MHANGMVSLQAIHLAPNTYLWRKIISHIRFIPLRVLITVRKSAYCILFELALYSIVPGHY